MSNNLSVVFQNDYLYNKSGQTIGRVVGSFSGRLFLQQYLVIKYFFKVFFYVMKDKG